jgi:hypothetical protein
MNLLRARSGLFAPMAVVTGIVLSGCAGGPQFGGTPELEAAPPPVQSFPPAYRPEELVGRWGYAAYHRPDDRARTEAAARGQCKQPYVIGAGPTGGIIMHLADKPQPQELRLKGGAGGKTYIGPEGDPGAMQDREIVAFDGRVLITRFLDPEVSGRYGFSVYVRCAPRA